jgi:SAM-dependent MidA family methyltransferase
MQSALYHPEFGYYHTERLKIGPAGDYYTSSNVHAAFGASLACLFADLLGQLDSDCARASVVGGGPAPEVYTIVEIGAGTGQLAHDILTALSLEHTELYSRINYVIAERSPAMERRQRERLSAYSEKVNWAGVTENGNLNVEAISGIVFSNELIDALPAHVVRSSPYGLQELYVTCDHESHSTSDKSLSRSEQRSSIADDSRLSSDGFCFSWRPLSSARLAPYVDRMAVPLSEGQIVEINLDAVDWLQGVAQVLSKGYLVTIDYGDVARHLYGQDRRRGTLRAFHRHTIAASLLERVGEQDITCTVNFTALIEYGHDAGLETVSLERQSAFLVRMGLIDRIAQMETHGNVLSDLKNRLAIKNLFVPGGASDNFRVLIQRKTRS